MPATTRSRRSSKTSGRQAAQRELVERGQKIPGVAEAIEVYGKLERYAGVRIGQAVPRIRHATGGNI